MAYPSPEFDDLPDYIIKITKEIWEDRRISTLHRYYAPDIVLRSTSGLIEGNAGVIADTMATLGECPDRAILAEDVIWSGDDEAGYLSSHRAVTTGTQSGYGPYGAPTNRRFCYRAIADCAVKEDVIYDEWLTRDSSLIALQLGFDPVELVRAEIARQGGPERATAPFGAKDDLPGRYAGHGNENEWGQRLADILERIMEADIAVIRREYDRAALVVHPGGREGWSFDHAEGQWMRLRAAFPSAEFRIEHRIGRSDPGQPHRAAVRWSLRGRHEGLGTFGIPTGAEVYIMGFTHAEFGPYGEAGWGLRREWTLFDELAIWKQILIHQG